MKRSYPIVKVEHKPEAKTPWGQYRKNTYNVRGYTPSKYGGKKVVSHARDRATERRYWSKGAMKERGIKVMRIKGKRYGVEASRGRR